MNFEDDLKKLLHQLDTENRKIVQEIGEFITQGNIAQLPIEQMEKLHRLVNDMLDHSTTIKSLKKETIF